MSRNTMKIIVQGFRKTNTLTTSLHNSDHAMFDHAYPSDYIMVTVTLQSGCRRKNLTLAHSHAREICISEIWNNRRPLIRGGKPNSFRPRVRIKKRAHRKLYRF